MEKKELIEKFEKDLHKYAHLYFENRQKNYNDFRHKGDVLAIIFDIFFKLVEVRKSSVPLVDHFIGLEHLLDISIGGLDIAINYKLNELTETEKIIINSVEHKEHNFKDITFSYGGGALFYSASDSHFSGSKSCDWQFVPFDQPCQPFIQDNFYSFLLKQDKKEIEKLSMKIEKEAFKLII